MRRFGIEQLPSLPWLLLMTTLLTYAGCSGEVMKSLEDMQQLSQDLSREYNVATPSINLHDGHVLSVTLVNTPYNTLSDQEKKQKTREIALFVKKHYRGIEVVDTIVINLETNRGIGFISANSGMSYPFKTAELK
jgi:hypothetical protein